MAVPSSRQTLIDYCLRRLGSPVIEINVDTDQVEDRVDDALAKFREFHMDATVRVFLKHQVTADDITNGYIPIAADIPYITKVFPLNPEFSNVNMFDIRYQMMLNSLGDFMQFAGGMSYYYQLEQYLDYIDQLLTGRPIVTFSRNQNRLYLHGNFEDKDVTEGQFIVMEAEQLVDEGTFNVWNDTFMRDYTTQLIKQQWGANLIKFDGMQLPGGVTISGRQLYDEATEELVRLEEKMRLEYEQPVGFFIG
jgi:hypothetical protein